MDSKNGGIALIGSGYWGKNLARNFHALGALSLICDKNETLLEQFRGQYPGVDTCLAFSEVLRRPDIAGVVVATPAETHAALAREALAAGKHVYVEKPLALDEAAATALAQQAEAAGLVLMVGHLLQYHPVFIRLKELTRSGDLGRINYIYSNRLNLGKIRREENILWSFAPHDISMILSLADEMPCRVMATGGNYLHREIADVTTTHLEFPSGLKAHIFVSWLHPFKEQKLVVVGDKKMAVFDDTLPWDDKLLLYPHAINWKDHMPVPVKAEAERCEIHQAEPLRMECDHFLACIRNARKPITDGEEGLAVLRVLNAAQRSMDRACAVEILPTLMPSSEHGYFAHVSAIVDEGVSIGEGTKVWQFSHVLKGSSVGRNCNLGQNVVVGPDVHIGNGCKIQNNVSVYKGVTLENEVFCGPSMVFTNVDNPRAHIRRMDQIKPTLIRKGATLGANCTIVCGNTVGRYAFVGAGAVVTRDVEDHAMVYGNPARPMGWVCACGEQLGPDLVCPACGTAHTQGAFGLVPAAIPDENKGAA